MLALSTATPVAHRAAQVSVFPFSGYVYIPESGNVESAVVSLSNQRFFTVAQLSLRLQYSTSWIYKLHSRGILPSFTRGGRILFAESEVLAWLGSRSFSKEATHG